MGDNLIRDYLSELDAVLAVAPGTARARAAIVAEIRDGLADAVADHLDHGHPPALAARRAVEDFGTATALADQFVPILATAQVHRYAFTLLRTGPLVGVLWLITLILAASRGLPLASPLIMAAGIVAAAALMTAVPCSVFAVATTGRGSRWWKVAPSRAARAAQLAADAAILSDLILLVSLATHAPTVLAVSPGAVGEAMFAGLAALASLIRLTLTTRGAIRLRRTRALLATA